MTPDLVSQFQSNEILTRGFRDPKCMAAMELMQKDPSEAIRKFQGDPQVTAFLQEFGKLMAGHFETLGSSQEHQQQQAGQQDGVKLNAGATTGSKIEEIGPLQAKALQKQAANQGASSSSNRFVGLQH
jgi:hypothetical protein